MPIPPGSKLVGGTPATTPPSPGMPLPPPLPPKSKSSNDAKKYLPYIIGIFLCILISIGAYELGTYRSDDKPGPSPSPVATGTLWVTLIYDQDNPTQEFAHIESDNSLVEFITLQKGHLRIISKDSKLVKSNNFSQFVDKYGYPTLIIQSDESKKITAEKCPDTAGKIIDEIKKYKGIK